MLKVAQRTIPLVVNISSKTISTTSRNRKLFVIKDHFDFDKKVGEENFFNYLKNKNFLGLFL